MEYINIAPSWSAAVRIYIAVLEDGTETGKKAAREELIRLAQQYDNAIDHIRKLEAQLVDAGLEAA